MKKYLALLLSILLLLGVTPTAFAASAEEVPESVISILQELGAENPTVKYNTRNTVVGDNLAQDPATKIEFNDSSYAFLDNTGDIIRIKRVSEIRELKKYRSVSTSKFETVDSLKAYIEDTLIGTDYELVNEYYFSEDTLALRYEKILFNDALDRYDYISVRINTTLVELETFYKKSSGFKLEEGKDIISEDKARVVANEVFDANEKLPTVRLATVKTNNFFDNAVEEGNLRLAYMISSPTTVVYVDAYTATIIGGDIYKAVLGGAIGASELSTSSASINLAKTALESMGYTTTTKTLSSQFGTDVPPLLKSAFYSCSHGNATMISSRKDLDDENRAFYSSDVPSGTYKFVFLDACNTASSQWKTAFNISSSSSNKAFLGWTSTVTTTASYDFCVDFWSYISSTYTIYEAAQDAADNDADKPIQFTGDSDYDGYY
ncbi:MAG TPA: hypothetical protein VJZ06_02905 [Mobilitalea sp.]|nr:hypothetical protein [Mobilitalea sp.]